MKPFFKELLNVPNTMSLARIGITPIVALFWFAFDWKAGALAIGTVAGLTDQVDGYVARRLNQTTELGGLLDQLGDLLFESICLFVAVMSGDLWMGVLILYLFREFCVSVVRAYVVGKGGILPSANFGRFKSSCIQWAFFPFFLGAILLEPGRIPEAWTMVGVPPGRWLFAIAKASIYSGLVLGYISGWLYLKSFMRFYVDRQVKTS